MPFQDGTDDEKFRGLTVATTGPVAATLGGIPHVDGVLTRLACARVTAAGIALKPLLQKADLTLQQVEDSRRRLAFRDQIRFLNLVAEALSDDLLGFHLAQHCDLREAGMLYYVLASSDRVIDAVRRVVRYGWLANEGVLQRCVTGSDIAISLQLIGVDRKLDCHQVECWMLLLVRILRHLTGQPVRPQRVRFVHVRETPPPEFEAYFGSDVQFGAEADEIAFAGTIASVPIATADPYLNELLVRYYEQALAARRAEYGSIRALAEDAIVPLLPHAEVRMNDIARRLGLSPRTFARRLRADGLSFSDLLGQLRLDLANRYLAEGDTSISKIAWLLGYQETAAFSKAYRRWTGTAPRSARGSALAYEAANDDDTERTSLSGK